jgi:hypothetical protein
MAVGKKNIGAKLCALLVAWPCEVELILAPAQVEPQVLLGFRI